MLFCLLFLLFKPIPEGHEKLRQVNIELQTRLTTLRSQLRTEERKQVSATDGNLAAIIAAGDELKSIDERIIDNVDRMVMLMGCGDYEGHERLRQENFALAARKDSIRKDFPDLTTPQGRTAYTATEHFKRSGLNQTQLQHILSTLTHKQNTAGPNRSSSTYTDAAGTSLAQNVPRTGNKLIHP